MRGKRIIDPRNPPALLGGRPPAATMGMLIAFGVVFLIMVFSASEKVASFTALRLQGLWEGEVWRVLTAPFFFGMPQRLEVLSVLGSGVVLWAFGSLLERWWGTKRLLWFFCVCTITGHLVAAFLAWAVWPQMAVGGIAPGATALALAAALVFKDRGLGLNFRGQIYGLDWWVVLLVIGGILVLGTLVDLVEGRPIVDQVGELAAAGVAYLLITDDWRPGVRRRRRRIQKAQDDVQGVLQFPGGRVGKRGSKKDPHRWN